MASGCVDIQSVWGFVAPMLQNWGGGGYLKVCDMRRLDFQRIELHVDLVIVVLALNLGACRTPCGRSHVMKIKRLLDMDWKVVIQHTYREVNQCVDALANFGCSLNSVLMFFYSCAS